MDDAKQREAVGHEIIRQAFTWTGLILGLAIVLKDVIEPTEFTYVLLVTLVAWMVAMTPTWRQQQTAGKWTAPISAALVILTAVALKLVMGW